MTTNSKAYSTNKMMGQIGIILLTIVLQGCTPKGYYIVASTGTVIGVELSQNLTTKAPQGKLGYNRAEFALVPTNRSGGIDAKEGSFDCGAKDSANVLMELRYDGIWDASASIYQRLAVGDIAVRQTGAAAMFLKDATGTIDLGTAQALKTIPLVEPSLETKKRPVSERVLELRSKDPQGELAKFNDAARSVGYQNIEAVLIDPNVAPAKIDQIFDYLKKQDVNLNCQ